MSKVKKTRAERLKKLNVGTNGGVGDGGLATAPRQAALNISPVEKLGLGPVSHDASARHQSDSGNPTLIASISDLCVSILRGDDNDAYYRFEASGRSTAVPSKMVIGKRLQVFEDLRRIGIFATSAAMKMAIGDLIDTAKLDSSTFVATKTGFEQAHPPRYFIYGDGNVISADANLRVMSSIENRGQFERAGDLKVYEEGIAKVVRNQSIPMVMLFFGLAQILKPFVVGTGYKAENMMFELIGPSTNYKTALACTLVASAWGKPGDNGYARNWNLTPEKIGELFSEYNGHVLVLDEATMAGSDDRTRAERIGNIVHRMSSGQSRGRYNEETKNHSIAVLSTSNQPLREIFCGTEDVRHALEVRSISLKLRDGDLPFDTVPQGFANVRAAMGQLFKIAAENYGLVAREFIEDVLKLSQADHQRLTAIIKNSVSKFLEGVGMASSGVDGIAYRRVQPFALAYAAAIVAFKVGTLRKGQWGHVKRTIRRAWMKYGSTNSPTSVVDPRIWSYMNDSSNVFVDIRDGHKPTIVDDNFNKVAGFIFAGKDKALCLAVPNAAMAKLAMSTAFLKHLKRVGILRAGKSLQSKLALRRVNEMDKRDVFYVFRIPDVPSETNLRRDHTGKARKTAKL